MATTRINTNTAASGATNEEIATKTISAEKYQKMLVSDPTTGAEVAVASEGTLAAVVSSLTSLIAALGSPEQAGASKPITAAALPLPSGAASEATLAARLPVTPVDYTYTFTGVIALNTDVLIIDCAQFPELSIDLRSMGTTGVLTAQWGSTNAFPNPQQGTVVDSSGATSTTSSVASIRRIVRQARWLRLRMTTATTAGTTDILVTGFPTVSTTVSTVLVGSTLLATPTASTTQGASTPHRQALVANITTGAPTSVKTSVAVINSAHFANNSGVGVWVHIYNKTSAPTLGTDTPVLSFWVPAGSTLIIPGGTFGNRLSTGFAYAVCDNCSVIPTAGGTITIASAAAAICISFMYT